MLKNMKHYFNQQHTKSLTFRLVQLKKLENALKAYENEIYEALYLDLNKSKTEAFLTEIQLIYAEIHYFIKHLKKMMKKHTVKTPLALFPSKSYYTHEPYGVVCIFSPWNYPIQLSFIPLIGAIAAGNCVVLKPSEYSIHSSNIIQKIINHIYDKNYIQVVQGDATLSEQLSMLDFDYIFFTGNSEVGKKVMRNASERLIPLTLELGGKSCCIVDEDVALIPTIRRIIFGKLMNAGQTCVAVDYVCVHENIVDKFIQILQEEIKKYDNEDLAKIISLKHYERLVALLSKQNIEIKKDDQARKIYPTFCKATFDDPIMQEEIFGPVLPIITYQDIDTCILILQQKQSPLACYIFSNCGKNIEKVTNQLTFGGGCINDTLVHVSNHHLPFGGVKQSGIGRYHGYASFETFTYKKSIVKNTLKVDIPLRYPPYSNIKKKIINFLLRK